MEYQNSYPHPLPSVPTLRIEIWVDDAHWSLTESDGQLQLADICLTNFSYNRLSFSDDSGEHRVELGTFKVQNLIPNTQPIYQVSVLERMGERGREGEGEEGSRRKEKEL